MCWGENELVKRMEEREPNLVANTTHSISRRGVRRSDLNDQELKLILRNLLPLVRTDYILPPFHQVCFFTPFVLSVSLFALISSFFFKIFFEEV